MTKRPRYGPRGMFTRLFVIAVEIITGFCPMHHDAVSLETLNRSLVKNQENRPANLLSRQRL
jgi:hypothetical protein